MNEELLKTVIVKGSIERYLKLGLTLREIKNKLEDIHLIIVSDEELKNFIFRNLPMEYYRKIEETEKYINKCDFKITEENDIRK